MKNLILKIYDYFSEHRLVFWLVMPGVFLLFAALAFRISFEEDISRMLQMDEKMRDYRKLVQNTRLIDKLVLCVSDKTPELSPEKLKMEFCDSLAARLNTLDASLVKKVIATPGDFPFMEVYQVLLRNLPFFIEAQDYRQFDSLLQPAAIRKRLSENTRLLSSPAGILIRQGLSRDPAGISNPVTLRLQQLGQATGYETHEGYFFSKDKKNLVLFIEPANPASETGKNTLLIRSIDGFIRDLQHQERFRRLDCSYMGATAVAVGNARQIHRDTLLTLALMCASLVLLITAVFRKKRTPLLIFLPMAFGMVFALGCISFIEKEISLIAIGATSVLLGIAVNYPIHILTHRLHEPDLRKVIAGMVEPMTIGSATTIGGFACLLLVKAEILHDFGLLGVFGLIGAVLFSLVFLPHLIGKQDTEPNRTVKWLEKAGQLEFEKNRVLRWSVILLTPVLFYFAQFIRFDSDLMHLNYMSPELRRTEQVLRGNDSLVHPVYVISFGVTFDQALASAGSIKHLSDSLNQAGVLNKYTGIADFLPSLAEQQRRAERWRNYFTGDRKQSVLAALKGPAAELGYNAGAFDDFTSLLTLKSEKIDPADFRLMTEVFASDAVTVSPGMTTIVSVMRIPVSARSGVEQSLSDRQDARMLDNKYLSAQLSSMISSDFNFIAVFSALLVFIALLLTYRRLGLAVTAFVPMVVSWIWILGLMGLFRLEFNIVNIILSTFIFGLGDDYCIFMMDGLLQQHRTGKKPMPVIRMSILLSGLTTILGFGVMIIARHPALNSIALVSVIGIVSVLLVSQVLEPWLFRFFVNPRSRRLKSWL